MFLTLLGELVAYMAKHNKQPESMCRERYLPPVTENCVQVKSYFLRFHVQRCFIIVVDQARRKQAAGRRTFPDPAFTEKVQKKNKLVRKIIDCVYIQNNGLWR